MPPYYYLSANHHLPPMLRPLRLGVNRSLDTVATAPEIAAFAKGHGKDVDAVRAALSSEWSNGQTKGQVNRLKLIKRQIYGRANFDLLRARVLPLARAA